MHANASVDSSNEIRGDVLLNSPLLSVLSRIPIWIPILIPILIPISITRLEALAGCDESISLHRAGGGAVE